MIQLLDLIEDLGVVYICYTSHLLLVDFHFDRHIINRPWTHLFLYPLSLPFRQKYTKLLNFSRRCKSLIQISGNILSPDDSLHSLDFLICKIKRIKPIINRIINSKSSIKIISLKLNKSIKNLNPLIFNLPFLIIKQDITI